MRGVAFGQRGGNPAKQHSFIVTEELAPTISLEDYCREWPTNPPRQAMKRALLQRVADVITSYSIHYTKLYDGLLAQESERSRIDLLVFFVGVAQQKLLRFVDTPGLGERQCAGFHVRNNFV